MTNTKKICMFLIINAKQLILKKKIFADYMHQQFKAHLSCNYVSLWENLLSSDNLFVHHTYAAKMDRFIACKCLPRNVNFTLYH